jgi:hypothetical protein
LAIARNIFKKIDVDVKELTTEVSALAYVSDRSSVFATSVSAAVPAGLTYSLTSFDV